MVVGGGLEKEKVIEKVILSGGVKVVYKGREELEGGVR